jgi:CHAD domain-containing protein
LIKKKRSGGVMSIRLQQGEPVPQGIRRIAAEQIEGAIQELGDRRRNPHKAIHSARQRCKRLRGLLRLVRCDLGECYQTENRHFRDIARDLSDLRDAEAVIEAADKLYSVCDSQQEVDLLRRARRSLLARRRVVAQGETNLAGKMAAAAEAFRAAHERIAAWPLSTSGFDLLRPGICSTYAGSRKAFSTAFRKPSDARFHEARKRVKYHWYQMRMLHNIWPQVLGVYRAQLKELSDLLGDDHDLSVMRGILRESPEAALAAPELEVLFGVIERRKARLRATSHVLGRRIFAERPRCFTRRLGDYWQAWEEEAAWARAAQQAYTRMDERAVA